MFSRYLGQSIGAAILGGIFNMAMGSQLTGAPGTLKSQLPSKVNDVIEVLQSGKASGPAEDYLRHSFYVSAHHVYIAMAILAALSLLALLMLPKEYPIVSD